MSITAYVGLPGHGKSYGVVENVIAPALKNKRTVFTNIPMNADKCMEMFDCTVVQFDINDIIENPNWWKDTFESGAILVLDEAYKLWPAGLKANAMRETDKWVLAEHRHMVVENGLSTEIVIVVQKLNMIASYSRALIETTFWVVKHTKVGLNKNFRVDVYFGAMDGSTPQLAKREREIQGRFKQEIFELYSSHTMSKTGSAGDETRTDNRFNILKGFSVKAGIVLFLCLIGAAIYGFNYFFDNITGKKEPVAQETVEVETKTLAAKNPSVGVKSVKKSFLSDVDSIVISHSLTSSIEGIINTVYFFLIEKDDNQVILSDSELSYLGYTYYSINDCLIEINGNNYKKYVMCPKQSEEGNFLTRAMDSTE